MCIFQEWALLPDSDMLVCRASLLKHEKGFAGSPWATTCDKCRSQVPGSPALCGDDDVLRFARAPALHCHRTLLRHEESDEAHRRLLRQIDVQSCVRLPALSGAIHKRCRPHYVPPVRLHEPVRSPSLGEDCGAALGVSPCSEETLGNGNLPVAAPMDICVGRVYSHPPRKNHKLATTVYI